MGRRLSIVIPVYNERPTLARVVEAVSAVEIDAEKEVIAVDDGSTDGSSQLLADIAGKHPEVRAIYHARNCGKGAALRTGFRHATGDFVIIQDADLECDPRNYPRLLEPLFEGRADVVYGSRFIYATERRVLPLWHTLGNRCLTMLSNVFTNLHLTDMETGFKVFRRDVIQRLELVEDRFGFEPEVTAKLARIGARIYEIPIEYQGRTVAEGKKIGWKDAVRTVYCIVKFGLARRPRR